MNVSENLGKLQKSHRSRGLSKLLFSTQSWPWVTAEFVLVYSAFLIGASFSRFSAVDWVQSQNQVTALAFAFFFCAAGIGFGLFEREARLSRLSAVRSLVLSIVVALCASLSLVHLLLFIQPGRYVLIYGSFSVFSVLAVWHVFLSWLAFAFPQRYLFLGDKSPLSSDIDAELSRISQSAAIRRNLKEFEERLLAKEQSWNLEEAMDQIIDHGITDLIITQGASRDPRITQLSVQALQCGLRVVDESTVYAEIFRKYPVAHLDIRWAIGAGFDIHRPFTNFVKRAFDILLASISLVLLSPVLIVLALLVWATSPGPVFYVQERQGRFFRPIKMIKFRSMYQVSGSRVTSKGDVRVTKIGALMRPLHLDELPQIWNILVGDMSFVGPRPAMIQTIHEVREKLPLFEIRQMLRPGLSGLAQISQGYSLDSENELQEKLGFDLFYIRHYSLSLDLWIILRTAFNLAKKAW